MAQPRYQSRASSHKYRWNNDSQSASKRAAPTVHVTSFSTNALQTSFYRLQASSNAQRKPGRGYVPNAVGKHSIAPFPRPSSVFAKAATVANFLQQSNVQATWNVPAMYVNPHSVPSEAEGPIAIASSLFASSLFASSQQPKPANSHGDDAAFSLQKGEMSRVSATS